MPTKKDVAVAAKAVADMDEAGLEAEIQQADREMAEAVDAFRARKRAAKDRLDKLINERQVREALAARGLDRPQVKVQVDGVKLNADATAGAG